MDSDFRVAAVEDEIAGYGEPEISSYPVLNGRKTSEAYARRTCPGAGAYPTRGIGPMIYLSPAGCLTIKDQL